MNQLQTSDSENAPSHSQRDENTTAHIPRQSLPLGEKDDNIREALRQKLDFKNSGRVFSCAFSLISGSLPNFTLVNSF